MLIINRDSQYIIAERIVKKLRESGYNALFAGGCVRDMLLGIKPKDYDIATNAMPDEIQNLFNNTHNIGKAFGVIQVVIDNFAYEVTTFRFDGVYKDGRHPESISYSSDKEDALRRDFTINGLFYDPLNDSLIDYVNGEDDLKKGIIKAIGNTEERFMQDHLRMLRALRFAATLGFVIEENTAQAIKSMGYLIKLISAERIQQELTRIFLEAKKPGDALKSLEEYNLLIHILPEVHAMIGQEQPKEFHPEGDVFTHTIIMLNAMQKRDKILAYSILLHDVGKPVTAKIVTNKSGEQRLRFDSHAREGSFIAEKILNRLRFSTKEIEMICYIIDNHMTFSDVQNMREAKLRRMIAAPTFAVELELHRLDCLASNGFVDNYEFLVDFQKKIANEKTLPEALINGHDVMNILNIKPGPIIGDILEKLYEKQIEEKILEKEELLSWLNKNKDFLK